MQVRFDSLYSHGFARVAAAVPHLRVADPEFNCERTLRLARQASDSGAALVVFPELGLSGYSIDDLHHQQAVLGAVERAVGRLVAASFSLRPVLLVGRATRGRRGGVQHRRRDPRRAGARRGAQELPAGVPRVLREAPVQGGA